MKLPNLFRRSSSQHSIVKRASDAVPIPLAEQQVVEDVQDNLHPLWERLVLSYGSDFSRIEGGKAVFFIGLSMSERTNAISLDKIPLLISGFEHDRNQFQVLKGDGALDIAIPKDINFAPFSGPFSEEREMAPTDRPALPVYSGGKKLFVTTKDRVSIETVTHAYDELIGVFEKALRTAMSRKHIAESESKLAIK